jgi:peptidoglycan hydrolase CwlO-like protein
MAGPPRRTIVVAALVLLALVAGPAPAGAAQIEDKRAEAAAIASKLQDQAKDIVALDKERRRAQAELLSADAAVTRAEADLAAAARRQDEARRLLAAHAQAAYVGGGTVTFLAQMARSSVLDAGARRTYLRVVAGEDMQAIGRLQVAREDLEVRQRSLTQARRAAAVLSEATAADVAGLEKAMDAQRSLLARANGELLTLVAAEQARREADEARAAAAAAAARELAAPGPVPAAASRAPAAPATTAAPAAAARAAPATTAAPARSGAPPPNASDEETFACIRQLESGNNYKSPGGGAYQFQDATWHSLGYTGSAQDHPPEVQDEGARRLKARDGWKPWTTAPLCGKV